MAEGKRGRPKLKEASHDMWMYKEGEEPRIFKEGEKIPTGWKDTP